MIDLLARAEALAQPWADLYNDRTVLQVGVTFLHIGGFVVAGGLALAADRSTLRVAGEPAQIRGHHLAELGAVHRPVLIGLVVTFLSGVLLFGSDVATYGPSYFFWGKMALIAGLLANGALLSRTERRLQAGGAAVDQDWTALRHRAVTSMALWLSIVLVGTILPNLSNVASR
ncbi:MAG TPA: hypothetical protein VGR60_07865 [Gemmatimonadales bacterium]|nr:hypothetical protein [Gemmatimonadales bacterium]